MAKTVLNKTYWAAQEFLDPSETVILTKNGRMIVDGGGIYLSPSTANSKVRVDGEIVVKDTAVYIEGDGSTVTIGKTASLHGNYAVVCTHNDWSGTNNGALIGDDDVVFLAGTGGKFTNNGVMRGEDGVKFAGTGNVFINGVKGVIEVWDNAIEVGTFSSGDTTKTINKGLMMNSGWPDLFVGNDSDDTFINKGTANGVIRLADGKDTFDNRGGKFQGLVYGGGDDDTLYTDKASLKLIENAGDGDDRVYASVTYTLSAEVERLTLVGKKAINGTGTDGTNYLTGNAAANKLFGLAGDDTLDGGKGNDRLTGGDNADTFIFSTGYGKDTITDFVIGTDDIDLSGWKAIASFQDLLDNHAEDKNGNVEITAGKDKLILIGVSEDNLLETDFHFQTN